jgi:hypothetical protein
MIVIEASLWYYKSVKSKKQRVLRGPSLMITFIAVNYIRQLIEDKSQLEDKVRELQLALGET